MSSASVFGSFYREVVSSKNKAATITNLRIKQNSYSTRAFCRPNNLEGVVSGTYLNWIRQSWSEMWMVCERRPWCWVRGPFDVHVKDMLNSLVRSCPSVLPWMWFSEARGTDFAIENNICRLNIRKSRSSALKNDNKVARQVYRRDEEPSRIRKAKLCRTMHKRSNRKGLKFLIRQLIRRKLYSSLFRTAFSMQSWNLVGSLNTAVIAFNLWQILF